MMPLIGAAVDYVADLVALHPGAAVLVAFLAAVVEAVAVLGVVIPGTPILMAVAGAAAMAGAPMTPIMVVAILGAVIGDGVSYCVGLRYGGRLAAMWPLSRFPGCVAKAEAFFRRYGAVSVAACRFVPVLRSTVPLVAGMAGMARGRFLAANVFSALIWAPAHVLPAQVAGRSLNRLQAGDWHMAALGGATLLLLCGALWFAHRGFARRVPT